MPDNTEKARKVGYPLATYRYVRLILVAVVAALFASVTLTAKAAQWCWQPSISAFYYTHAHAVFIGALVHDIADWKFHDGDDSIGPREAARTSRPARKFCASDTTPAPSM